MVVLYLLHFENENKEKRLSKSDSQCCMTFFYKKIIMILFIIKSKK